MAISGVKPRQLGDDLIWPPAQVDQQTAATEAKKLLDAAPGRPAAEVPMLHERVYARADALVPDEQGYVLRETKASNFPLKPDKVRTGSPKAHHLDDLAIQVWVMTKSGLL